MAPPNAASAGRLAAALEAPIRPTRRLARIIDLRQEEMIEDGDRGGDAEAEAEGEGVVEAESGVEEDGGATEPGSFLPDMIVASALSSLSASSKLNFYVLLLNLQSKSQNPPCLTSAKYPP